MSLFAELRKRNVFRAAAAYVVVAWLIIQVVETIFPAFGFGDAAIRVVVICFAIGLVPVLVLSWLFEITPAGFKRESAVDHQQPIALRAARNFDRAIIIVLTLAVGFFAFDKFVLDPARDTEMVSATTQKVRSEVLAESYGDSSIAVLPFTNMSEDPGNQYFSEGISEELLNLLAHIPGLRVISKSSSFSYQGKTFTIPQVAEQLNVAFVLEGSVRRLGQQVRITAQLIEARSDTHLWSETYDRTLDDLFAVQDEISAAIVEQLKDRLNLDIGQLPRAGGTASAEAHDAELRGRYLLAQRTPGARTSATEEFEKAIKLDPGFALAHAELAIALALGGCGEITDAQCLVKTASHAEKALVLAPELAEAHAAKAWLSLLEDRSEDAHGHFQRALEINPNYAVVYTWMANSGLLASQAEIFAAIEMALQLDPMSPVNNVAYVHNLVIRGRLDEASQQVAKLAQFEPRLAGVLQGGITSLGGNWSSYILAALEALEGGLEGLSFSWAAVDGLAWHLAMIGLNDEALQLAGEGNALMLGLLGDPEQAVELAQAQLVESPSNPFTRFRAGFALAHAGHYAQARPLLRAAWQSMFHDNPGEPLGWHAGYTAQALIAVLRLTGEPEEAERVLAEFREAIRKSRDAGITQTQAENSLDFLEGIAYYLAGQSGPGLELMGRAVDQGYWIRPASGFQQDLYQNPAFVALLEKQAVRQARERGKVLEAVCGNTRHSAFWQPAPETCAEFLEPPAGSAP